MKKNNKLPDLVIQQRKVVDRISEAIQELTRLEEQWQKSPEYDEDLSLSCVISLCQHRHLAEKHGVDDHAACMNFVCVLGKNHSVSANIAELIDSSPGFMENIAEAQFMWLNYKAKGGK